MMIDEYFTATFSIDDLAARNPNVSIMLAMVRWGHAMTGQKPVIAVTNKVREGMETETEAEIRLPSMIYVKLFEEYWLKD